MGAIRKQSHGLSSLPVMESGKGRGTWPGLRGREMPWLPKHCIHPGCTEKIMTGSYCDTHRKEKQQAYDADRDPKAVKFYGSKRWRNIRTAKLNRSPLCERCLSIEKRIEQAVTVHHINGNIADNVDENLQSLCLSCHSKKESECGNRF